MEASISSHMIGFPTSKTFSRRVPASAQRSRPHHVHFNCNKKTNLLIGRTRRLKTRVSSINDDVVPMVADPEQAAVTWQIVVGTIAGVTPFVVAGIEFSKRIIAQKKCTVCGGSGLVLRDKKYYFRCPGCGGFLPWQSWKRFFSG